MKTLVNAIFLAGLLADALSGSIAEAANSAVNTQWNCAPQALAREVTESRWELAQQPFRLVFLNENLISFTSTDNNSRYPQLKLNLNSTWSPRTPSLEGFVQFRGTASDFSYEAHINSKSVVTKRPFRLLLRERSQDRFGTATFSCRPV